MPLLRTSRSCASSLHNFFFFMSSNTQSFQVFLPLSLPPSPASIKSLHADTQSPFSFCSTCPNHLYRPCLTLSHTPTKHNLCLSSSLSFESLSVAPHIHLTPNIPIYTTHPPLHHTSTSLFHYLNKLINA